LLTTPEQLRLVILSRLPTVNENNKLASLMSGIVHEIKTPLTSAKLAVDVLAEIPNTTPQQLNLLKRAQVNFEYMLVLVHELLNMAWMESGNDLVMNPTDLVKLTREAVRQIESYAEHHGVEIRLICRMSRAMSKAIYALEGVLSNLLIMQSNIHQRRPSSHLDAGCRE
jgi:signal transduction histidine kinase